MADKANRVHAATAVAVRSIGTKPGHAEMRIELSAAEIGGSHLGRPDSTCLLSGRAKTVHRQPMEILRRNCLKILAPITRSAQQLQNGIGQNAKAKSS